MEPGRCEHAEIERTIATLKVGRTVYEHDRLRCTACEERVVWIEQHKGARR